MNQREHYLVQWDRRDGTLATADGRHWTRDMAQQYIREDARKARRDGETPTPMRIVACQCHNDWRHWCWNGDHWRDELPDGNMTWCDYAVGRNIL